MRRALQQNPMQQRQGVAAAVHLPAPTGGWNTRDALQALPITDAVQLTNWFPSIGEVVMRTGYQLAATVGTSPPALLPVKSMYEYGNVTGSTTLFAVTDEGIYDISAGGVVLTPDQVLTEGYWHAVHQTNTAGVEYLWGANGVDAPVMFDGTTWSTPVITGPTTTNLVYPWLFKRRIWCVEINSMSAWYSDVDSIQGAFAEFPIGPLFSKGGYLVSGASWTIDGGNGPDDYTVFVTSLGEVALYAGVDPNDPADFHLVGVFYIGPPLGRRCFVKFGGDLIILTEMGAFPLSQALRSATIDYRAAVTNKIQPSFIAAAQLYRPNQGWEGIFFPSRNAMLVNVPVVPADSSTATKSAQFVMNTLTGSWCDFTGWNANCFSLFESELYFGADNGAVYKAWSTSIKSDLGANIVASAQTAFSYLSKSPGQKSVDLVRFLLAYDDAFDERWGLARDFGFGRLTGYAPRSSILGSSYWDLATWDVSLWSYEQARQKLWRAPYVKPGFAFSALLQISSDVGTVSWSGHDYLVNQANAVG